MKGFGLNGEEALQYKYVSLFSAQIHKPITTSVDTLVSYVEMYYV